MRIIGNTVGTTMPKPNLMQEDPSKGDYVKGKSIIPTKNSQLENDAGYLTEHQDISGKLDATALPDAINDALAQAKSSGEFDGPQGPKGEDGEPGTSGVYILSDGEVVSNAPADADVVIDPDGVPIEVYTKEETDARINELLEANSGSGGGASSWNDLKDKPFGEEVTECYIIPETSLRFEDETSCFEVQLDGMLVDGETYIVVINGTEYQCEARYFEDWDSILLGNGEWMGADNIGSDAPFSIESYDDGYVYLYMTSPGEFVVSIFGKKRTVYKLDAEYLPDDFMDSVPTIYKKTADGTYEPMNTLFIDASNLAGDFFSAAFVVSHSGVNLELNSYYLNQDGQDADAVRTEFLGLGVGESMTYKNPITYDSIPASTMSLYTGMIDCPSSGCSGSYLLLRTGDYKVVSDCVMFEVAGLCCDSLGRLLRISTFLNNTYIEGETGIFTIKRLL